MPGAAPTSTRAARVRIGGLAALALFACGQALLWYAYYGHGAKPLIGDELNYHNLALGILAGTPWITSTIWPPLQPLLLAALYWPLGASILAAQLLQGVLFVACALLLRGVWRRVGGSVAAANCAAALFLLNPSNAAYAHWLWPEVVHLALVLGVFWLLLARPVSRTTALGAGVMLGLAILAKSLLSAFWPLFLIAFVRRERPRFAFAPAALFVAGLAVVTAPALWHGYRQFGQPMIADSSMYNLWVGLNDQWRSDYVQDMGGETLPAFLASGTTPQQRNAVYRDKVRAFLAERGVAGVFGDQLGRQYFRLFSAKTPLQSQLPGAQCAGRLSFYRTPAWLTDTLVWSGNAFHALMLAGCAFGIVLWRRRPDRALWLIGLYVAYQLALFGVLHVKARFLFPMIPFLCGFAGSFLADLRARAGGAPGVLAWTTPRLAFGALLAALLLFLAFAGPSLDHLCAA